MINVLPKNIAELIAAGEVIERPASVIKELVENSIDAGATNVTVEIKNGGVTFMRVTDNGVGIERDDVKNAFLRHATSKIAVSDDLDHIATLGFRGEALASISAVSKVELMTRHKSETIGTLYRSEGGTAVEFSEAGCPLGTTFVVRDLFYNVPARMKFLKKDASESNNIATLMDRIALSHPEISFTLIRDGRQTLKTSGKGDLAAAIYQVFGKQFYDSLLPVSYDYQGVKAEGFVTKPVNSNRASRSMQTFFVNGRYVRTKTGIAALEQAYKGFIMTGKYPACVLKLTMNCQELDVNVHPAKLEIRFTNEKPVYDAVYYAARTALSGYDTRNQQALISNIDPKLLAPTADRGAQLGFAPVSGTKQADASDSADEPIVYMPKPVDHDALLHLQDAAAAKDLTAFKNVTVRPINLTEYRREMEEKKRLQRNAPNTSDVAAQSENQTHAGDALLSGEITELAAHSEKQTLAGNVMQSGEITELAAHSEKQTHAGAAKSDTVTPGTSAPLPLSLSEREPDVMQAFPALALPSDETLLTETLPETKDFRYIGEVFMTYLIVQYDDSRLMLIDKHAAHERLIYEKLKSLSRDDSAQMLLEPITVTLDKTDFQTVLDNRELLMSAGFEAEEFGSGTILLRSVPLFLEKLEVTEAFMEIVRYLTRHKKLLLSERMEWIYANTACRAAIKAGDKNQPQELQALVQQLQKNPQVRYCPHGRPIYYFLTRSEMEKNFKRI